MNSKGLNIFNKLLFFVGLAIIAIAFAIFNLPIPEGGLTASTKFLWAQIVVCYLVFFVPFFFSSITAKTVDVKITSTVHIWICVLIFEVIAILLTILVCNEIVQIKVVLLIELIVIFICAIFIYFGYFAGNHIGNVQQQEEISLGKIKELKTAFEMLNLKTDMWSHELNSQKDKIKKLCDDVRFMSPVDTEISTRLETKLIAFAFDLQDNSFSAQELDSKILELTNLVNQRKLLKK